MPLPLGRGVSRIRNPILMRDYLTGQGAFAEDPPEELAERLTKGAYVAEEPPEALPAIATIAAPEALESCLEVAFAPSAHRSADGAEDEHPTRQQAQSCLVAGSSC